MRENFFGIVGLSFLAAISFTGGLFAGAQTVPPGDLGENVPNHPRTRSKKMLAKGCTDFRSPANRSRSMAKTFYQPWQGAFR